MENINHRGFTPFDLLQRSKLNIKFHISEALKEIQDAEPDFEFILYISPIFLA